MKNLKNNPAEAIELLKKFKRDGISHAPKKGLDRVLEWQDLVGRSTMSDIESFFTGLSEDRYKDHFHWVNMNCLDQSTAIEILKMTTLADEIAKAHERVKAQYEGKVETLSEALKYSQAEVDEYREVEKADKRSIRIMQDDIERLRNTAAASSRENLELREKAAELETVKKAFAILNK